MVSVTPMPWEEVAMLYHLRQHEQYCRGLPLHLLDQHVENLNSIRTKTKPDERALSHREIPAVLRVILECECDVLALAAGLPDEAFATECLHAVIEDDVGLAMIYGACAGVSDEEKAFLLSLRQWATAKLVYDTRIVPLSNLGVRQLLAANDIAIFDDAGISKISLSFSKLFERGVLSGHFRSRTSGRRKPKKTRTYVI